MTLFCSYRVQIESQRLAGYNNWGKFPRINDSFEVNCKILPQIRSRPFQRMSFPINNHSKRHHTVFQKKNMTAFSLRKPRNGTNSEYKNSYRSDNNFDSPTKIQGPVTASLAITSHQRSAFMLLFQLLLNVGSLNLCILSTR
jgi:hypothetical protein